MAALWRLWMMKRPLLLVWIEKRSFGLQVSFVTIFTSLRLSLRFFTAMLSPKLDIENGNHAK
jgi:hypothetical protein